MDPIIAFGLAMNVCQAVDMGIKVAQVYADLAKGRDDRYTAVRDQAEELEKCNQALQDSIRDASVKAPMTAAEQDLLSVSRKCGTVSRALKDETTKMQIPRDGKRRTRKMVYVAVRSRFRPSKVAELEHDLKSYRTALQTRVIFDLRSQNAITQQQLTEIREFNESTRTLLHDVRSGQANLEHKTGQEASATRTYIANETTRIRDDIADLRLQNSAERNPKMHLERIIEALSFPEMNARYAEIQPAHRQTLQWIFAETDGLSQPWDSFLRWLERGNDIYWVSGKPGSGKSTLMRFILEDPRTRKALQVWYEGRVIVLPFFFYQLATRRLQKSLGGFERALMVQILRIYPAYSEQMMSTLTGPEANMTFDVAVASTEQNSIQWHIRKALELLTTEWKIHCCLFVDALDECEEGSQHDLMVFLKDLAGFEGVKVCASSRPEAEFTYALGRFPQLRLQDLTKNDIKIIVSDTIKLHSSERELGPLSASEMDSLQDTLLDKANGVFLWVHLALKSLHEGMIYDDSFEQLKIRLEILPEKLEELFKHILERIPKTYLQEAARYIKLLEIERKAQRGPLTTLTIAFTNLESSAEVSDQVLDSHEIVRRCRNAEKRVLLRTAGMIELGLSQPSEGASQWSSVMGYDSSKTRLRFIHRTAEEFIQHSDHALSPILRRDNAWNAAQELARCQLVRIRCHSLIWTANEREYAEPREFLQELSRAMSYLRIAEQQTQMPHTTLVNALVDCSQRMVEEIVECEDPGSTPTWLVLLGHTTPSERLLHPETQDQIPESLFEDEVPAIGLHHLAHDKAGMCASWGLEQTVLATMPQDVHALSYLLSCLMETSSNTCSIRPSPYLHPSVRPLLERWSVVKRILEAGGDPNIEFCTSGAFIVASRFRGDYEPDDLWRESIHGDGKYFTRKPRVERALRMTPWKLLIIDMISFCDETKERSINPTTIQRKLPPFREFLQGFLQARANAALKFTQIHRCDLIPQHQKRVHNTLFTVLEVEIEASISSIIDYSFNQSVIREDLVDILEKHGVQDYRHILRVTCWFGDNEDWKRRAERPSMTLSMHSDDNAPCLRCIYRNSYWRHPMRIDMGKRSDKIFYNYINKTFCNRTLDYVDTLSQTLTERVPKLLVDRVGESECEDALSSGTWPDILDGIHIDV